MKAESPATPVGFAWPTDEDGNPMALVTMGASEKIGMPNYSNVDLGPASVTRFVKDTPEEIEKGLRFGVQVCETVIGTEREAVVQVVKAALEAAERR